MTPKLKANFTGPEVLIMDDTFIYVGGDFIGKVEQTPYGTRVTLSNGKKVRLRHDRYTISEKFTVENLPGLEQFKADLLVAIKHA